MWLGVLVNVCVRDLELRNTVHRLSPGDGQVKRNVDTVSKLYLLEERYFNKTDWLTLV